MSEPAGVAVLGATGSIGDSTLRVLARHPDRFRVVALTAGRRADILDRLACRTDPEYVVVAQSPESEFRPAWNGPWLFGREAMRDAATDE